MQPTTHTFLTKKRLIIGGVILFILLIIYGYFELQFHVVNTNPGLGNVTNLTPFVKINFNKNISKDGLTLTADPAASIQSFLVDGKTITVKLAYPLPAKKKYSIHIGSVTAEDGSKITDKTFSYTVVEGDFSKLPEDQKKALNQDQLPGPASTIDPVLSHVPYSTLDFRIDPVIDDQNNLKLHVQLLLGPKDPASQVAVYQEEALAYLRSVQVDPAKYTIEYETIQETLQGR